VVNFFLESDVVYESYANVGMNLPMDVTLYW